ncbi:MAG: heparinase II/III family protein, partial [Lentisphaerota bacterium]
MKVPVGFLLGIFALLGIAKGNNYEYEIGGPLAGVKLPPYQTYHGEPPGSPGNSLSNYQLQLYPGSVENWRAYMFKYLPVRPLFDIQTQLKNWNAPAIPGTSSKISEEYAQPVYKVERSSGANFTGKFEPAVKTLRINPGDKIMEISLGELKPGMYCVRVVGAVPTRDCTAYCKDLFAVLEVNDQPDRAVSSYRKRISYVDQFYSVVEIYFNAPEKREYNVKLTSAPESKTYFLVRNVTLEDVFADFARKPVKRKSNSPLPADFVKAYKDWQSKLAENPAELKRRQELDIKIWDGFQGLNTHYWFVCSEAVKDIYSRFRPGMNELSPEELKAKYGDWKHVSVPKNIDTLMVNDKLGVSYSMADLRNGKPLPSPYPIQDNGAGVSRPDADGTKGWFNCPVASVMLARYSLYQQMLVDVRDKRLATYQTAPDATMEATHNALLAFARFAYDLPAMDSVNNLVMQVSSEGQFRRQEATRHRETYAWYLTWYTEYVHNVELYDSFYDLIKDNQELATSIGQHISWVNTPSDVVELFDTYLVQSTARRIMRYHYMTFPGDILAVAAVMGDKDLTSPWMEWAFSKTFSYPYPPTGLKNMIINANDRSGLRTASSTFYDEGAALAAGEVEKYCKSVGDKSFSMTDPANYPAVLAHCRWPLELTYAGYQFARIGDVTGPEKIPGSILRLTHLFRSGWEWSHAPEFAALLRQLDKTSSGYFQQDEWERICKAADTVERMPYLTQPSRSVPNWAGIIETGKRHDDFRFRRGAVVRTGCNYGHNHSDSLDLQLAAHGVQMVIDSGQRPGYSTPHSGTSALHNTVTVDGKDRCMSGWASNIVDSENLAYMETHDGISNTTPVGTRQVMLVDVNDNGPNMRLPVEKQIPMVKLEPSGLTPNGYIFDVFRERNPGRLRYNFHAMINSNFDWNALGEKSDVGVYAGIFKAMPDKSFGAKSPDNLMATWQMRRN